MPNLSPWNPQLTSWGNSGNIPNSQLTQANGTTPAKSSIPFWDAPLDPGLGLDPSNPNKSPWDTLFLAGLELPGRCRVQCHRGKRIDIKQAKGANYATLTLNGYDPAEIRIRWAFWTQGQWDMVCSIMPILERSPTKIASLAALAMDIRHPALQLRNISQVLIQTIGTPEPAEKPGVMEIKINAIEYRASKQQATKTVTGSEDLTVSSRITGKGPLVFPSQDPTYTAPPVKVNF